MSKNNIYAYKTYKLRLPPMKFEDIPLNCMFISTPEDIIITQITKGCMAMVFCTKINDTEGKILSIDGGKNIIIPPNKEFILLEECK